ncbi:MAG TPA: hypothetical protein VKZ53_19475 [Candidatus Angelobacter sp.]|nr:hypothetical protein [Candidatus Angelobacter sp.]
MRELKIIEPIALAGVIQAPSRATEDGDCPYISGWCRIAISPWEGSGVGGE